MKSIVDYRYALVSYLLLVLMLFFSTTSNSQDRPFDRIDRIVVFGTSLSDPGNAFVLLSDPSAFNFDETCYAGTPANVPPYSMLDDLLIPDGTYAIGGHHVTNGATWIEQFANGKGLSGNVRPALRLENSYITRSEPYASNYAVGGARASDFPCRFNLSDQLNMYLNDYPMTSDNTLVVIEMGSNDIRDALTGEPVSIISNALSNIGNTIQTLYAQGARKFLLVNSPSIGNTPSVQMLDIIFPGIADAANNLSAFFNSGLVQMQNELNQLYGIDIRILDLYTMLNEIISDPSMFGIENTQEACVTPGLPPFVCKKPDTYLFWDGIHPTKRIHEVISLEGERVLTEIVP